MLDTIIAATGLLNFVGPDQARIAVLSTLLILVASAVYIALQTKGASGDTIAILGPVNTGKTALFFKLRDWDEDVRPTYTSMSPNTAQFTPAPLKDKLKMPLSWMDFPGHGSKRLDLDLTSARAVVFMLDSTKEKELLQVSSYLMTLMNNRSLSSRRVPILIACNKQDQSKAMSVETITKKLLMLISAAIESAHDLPDLEDTASTSNAISFGEPGQPFEFSQAPMSISICASSVTKGELSSIVDFIAGL